MLKGNEGIKVGDVFLALWGYEQTNASYYQVVKISGKTMVQVRRINHKIVKQLNYMSQQVKPVIDSFKDDEIIRKKVHRYSDKPTLEMESYEYARQIFKDDSGEFPAAETSSYY